jgi:hypothetical protein
MTEPSANAIAAAWFVDPTDDCQWRWWDGSQWTDHVALRVPAEAQQVDGAGVSALAAVGDTGVDRWSVPALDAPLFPLNGYPKDVYPAFVAARRSLHVLRAPITGLRIAAGAVVMVMGAAVERGFGRELLGAGVAMIRRALWDVHDDARDAPWAEMFRKRGLDPVQGIHSRWLELQYLIPDFGTASSVNVRWSAGGMLGGMPATCGECFAEIESDDYDVTRSYRMFVAFELPPLAAARHRKVSVRRRGITKLSIGAPHGMREATFESIAVAKALKVHVDGAADDVSVRELFGPQLLAALGEHPVAWEQRRDLLIVHREVPSEPGREFDAFVRSAVAVARAYWADQD